MIEIYYANAIIYSRSHIFLFPNRKVWLILYWDILDTGNWNLLSDHIPSELVDYIYSNIIFIFFY